MKLREKYDPNRVLIVNKPFRWAGDQFLEGATFPEELANVAGSRKTRQLYDARYLRHGPFKSELVVADPTAPPQIVMPDFDQLSTDGLRNWLLNNNVAVADEAPREDMIKAAMTRWRGIHGIAEPNPETHVTVPVQELVEKPPETTDGVSSGPHSGHSSKRDEGPVHAGDTQTTRRKRFGQQGRPNRDVRDVHRRGH